MAQKSDSDSDGYEIMISPGSALNRSHSKPPKDIPKDPGAVNKVVLKKSRKKVQKSKTFKDSTSTPYHGNKKIREQLIPIHQNEAGNLSPPMVGPKPSLKLSEDEVLKKVLNQQKEAVAVARQKRLRKLSENLNKPEEYEPEYEIDKSYGEVEVEDIVNQYSDHLPLQVVVSRGIYGMEERYSLANSDRCVIHFIKRRELVLIHDPKTNKEFSVPVNSAIKFGVVYNPRNQETEAMRGIDFTYVSDILAETKLPKIGMAHLKDPDIIGMKSIELLVIQEVIFSENPMEPRKLRVYSITAKCYRDLPETQEINFKTTPSFMQQYLPDILKYIQNPCPLHVAMYRNPLGRPLVAPGIPSTMFRRPLYLKKRYTDILLIATGCSGDGGTEDSQPFEIPTDIDVDFEVIKLSPEEKEELKEESHALLEKLKDKDVRHHRYVGVSDEQHRMQLSLYKSVLHSEEGEGVSTKSTHGHRDADDDYAKANSGNRLDLGYRVELLEGNMKRCTFALAESKATIDSLTKDNTTLKDRVKELEETVAASRDKMETMESILKQIHSELDLNMCTDGPGGVTTPSWHVGMAKGITPPINKGDAIADSAELYERNRNMLSHMTKLEVARMLILAGLGQYSGKVEAENVSGDMLRGYDEVMLERQLEVKSKLHRLKLIRLIEGKASLDLYKLID